MSLPLSKVVDFDDFASPELVAYLGEINAHEPPRVGSTADDLVPDAKQWASAMLLRALDGAGAASAGRWIAGIGAGAEPIVFALARRKAFVFAVDSYLKRTRWSDEAPAGMLIDPARYSRLDVPTGHVIPIHSSALKVNLPSEAFDGVFSVASFERLGSLTDVVVAAREIARLLKPGGVAAIATEFRVDGPADRKDCGADMLLFTERTLEDCIGKASGLVLREPLLTRQSDRTFESRSAVNDFPGLASSALGLDEMRAGTANLVLYRDGVLFCPVVLVLHKDRPLPQLDDSEMAVLRRAAQGVDADNAAVAADLERYQRTVDAAQTPAAGDAWLFKEIERLQSESSALRAAYDRSNAWKHWPLMRPVRFVYRRVKRWRA
jgi:SAM-dependent methyltransferase